MLMSLGAFGAQDMEEMVASFDRTLAGDVRTKVAELAMMLTSGAPRLTLLLLRDHIRGLASVCATGEWPPTVQAYRAALAHGREAALSLVNDVWGETREHRLRYYTEPLLATVVYGLPVDLAWADSRLSMSLQEILTAFNYFTATMTGREGLAIPLGPVCLAPQDLLTIVCQILAFDVSTFKLWLSEPTASAAEVHLVFTKDVKEVASRMVMSHRLQSEDARLEDNVCFGLTARIKYVGVFCGKPLTCGDVLPFLRPTRCGLEDFPRLACGDKSSGIAFWMPKMVKGEAGAGHNDAAVADLMSADVWDDPNPQGRVVHVRRWGKVLALMKPPHVYMPKEKSSSADLYWRVAQDMLVMWQMKIHSVQGEALSWRELCKEVEKAVPWAALTQHPRLELVFVLVYHVTGEAGLPKELEWQPAEDHQRTVIGWSSRMVGMQRGPDEFEFARAAPESSLSASQREVDVVVLNIHGAQLTIGNMSAEPLLRMRDAPRAKKT